MSVNNRQSGNHQSGNQPQENRALGNRWSGNRSSGNRALGRVGENFAAEYLQRRGYFIIDRNWRGGNAEIDIVSQYHATVVFVEVKTRRSVSHGFPIEAITAAKRERMKRAALAWLSEHQHAARAFRFDVISIVLSPEGNHNVSHFENIEL